MRAVEASSRNEAVIQQAQNEVRSAQASIKFLEDELAKLQMGGPSGGGAGSPMRDGSSSQPNLAGYGGGGRPGMGGHPQGMVSPPRGGQGGNILSPSPSWGGPETERQLPPPPNEPASGGEAKQKNYTALGELLQQPVTDPLTDLLRYDAPLTGPKITRMLNQLQFKLQVEEQYKLGIEKMAQAYRAEGDKRLRNETEAKRIESDGKIQLLRKAKKRYETLAKFGAAVEDDEGESTVWTSTDE